MNPTNPGIITPLNWRFKTLGGVIFLACNVIFARSLCLISVRYSSKMDPPKGFQNRCTTWNPRVRVELWAMHLVITSVPNRSILHISATCINMREGNCSCDSVFLLLSSVHKFRTPKDSSSYCQHAADGYVSAKSFSRLQYPHEIGGRFFFFFDSALACSAVAFQSQCAEHGQEWMATGVSGWDPAASGH
ncbi:hypothetical protein BJ741DRAFT_360640 [Chytriomyces cf. hyalinus JEL632]|nr:hypothetical protein BJ741DRAFT_360640 [Chytriomyces cf. hyalinus JEL632]